MLLVVGCTDVSPVQRARQSRDMLNAAIRSVQGLRQVGLVNDRDYRRFYGLTILASDAQDKLDDAVVKAARGEANGIDIAALQDAASKALDDTLLLQSAFEKRRLSDLPATPSEGR